MLLVNAAVGGLTAGLFRSGARKSFWTGFARGAVAGTAVYAGKRLIGEGTAAGWWIGRHVASLGSSEVANAAHGRPILHSAVFPIGPVRFHVDRTAKRKVSPRLDLASTIATVGISMKPGSRLALRESAATGTLVFIIPEISNEIGGSTAGVLTLSELVPHGNFPPLESKRSVLTHEMVHAAQYDFGFTAWGDAMQSAISASEQAGKTDFSVRRCQSCAAPSAGSEQHHRLRESSVGKGGGVACETFAVACGFPAWRWLSQAVSLLVPVSSRSSLRRRLSSSRSSLCLRSRAASRPR